MIFSRPFVIITGISTVIFAVSALICWGCCLKYGSLLDLKHAWRNFALLKKERTLRVYLYAIHKILLGLAVCSLILFLVSLYFTTSR